MHLLIYALVILLEIFHHHYLYHYYFRVRLTSIIRKLFHGGNVSVLIGAVLIIQILNTLNLITAVLVGIYVSVIVGVIVVPRFTARNSDNVALHVNIPEAEVDTRIEENTKQVDIDDDTYRRSVDTSKDDTTDSQTNTCSKKSTSTNSTALCTFHHPPSNVTLHGQKGRDSSTSPSKSYTWGYNLTTLNIHQRF